MGCKLVGKVLILFIFEYGVGKKKLQKDKDMQRHLFHAS